MNACITRKTFVFTVFRRVFHSTLKIELCRHACRRRDPIISTCRYGKNMPTTALQFIVSSILDSPGMSPNVINKYNPYSANLARACMAYHRVFQKLLFLQ